MHNLRKITRREINKKNMVALGYCEIQTILNMFGYDFKIGYNAGVYGWNYDLYRIGKIDIVTGYNVPYQNYSNKEKKKKLIALENKIRKIALSDFRKQKEELEKEFLEIFR